MLILFGKFYPGKVSCLNPGYLVRNAFLGKNPQKSLQRLFVFVENLEGNVEGFFQSIYFKHQIAIGDRIDAFYMLLHFAVINLSHIAYRIGITRIRKYG